MSACKKKSPRSSLPDPMKAFAKNAGHSEEVEGSDAKKTSPIDIPALDREKSRSDARLVGLQAPVNFYKEINVTKHSPRTNSLPDLSSDSEKGQSPRSWQISASVTPPQAAASQPELLHQIASPSPQTEPVPPQPVLPQVSQPEPQAVLPPAVPSPQAQPEPQAQVVPSPQPEPVVPPQTVLPQSEPQTVLPQSEPQTVLPQSEPQTVLPQSEPQTVLPQSAVLPQTGLPQVTSSTPTESVATSLTLNTPSLSLILSQALGIKEEDIRKFKSKELMITLHKDVISKPTKKSHSWHCKLPITVAGKKHVTADIFIDPSIGDDEQRAVLRVKAEMKPVLKTKMHRCGEDSWLLVETQVTDSSGKGYGCSDYSPHPVKNDMWNFYQDLVECEELRRCESNYVTLMINVTLITSQRKYRCSDAEDEYLLVSSDKLQL